MLDMASSRRSSGSSADPDRPQTMLFSATLDGEVGELAQAYTRDPATFESRREVRTRTA